MNLAALQRVRLAMGLTVFLVLSAPAPAAEPLLEKVDLFEAGKDGYALYRIPGIVVTPKGTLLAYCEARKHSGSDWDAIDILLRRSTDGGKTWGQRQNVAAVEGKVAKNPAALKLKGVRAEDVTLNNPVAIVDHKSGVVHFLFCAEYNRCFHMRSDDDGKTFSKPVEITATFEKFRDEYAWQTFATGPAHGVQLKNGRLLVPVWLAKGTGGNAHRPSVLSTIYSDDQGKTWKRGDVVAGEGDPLMNPNETALAQLADGRVMLNIRSESKQHRRAVCFSDDGATKWTKPAFDDQLREPICMASLCRLSEKPASDRNRLLFANPDNLDRADGKEAPGVGRDRKNLTVKLSYDEGKTWAVSKVLEAGYSGYSDLAAGPDGVIYCFYERGSADGKSSTRTARLTLARFNLEWLTDGKDKLAQAQPRSYRLPAVDLKERVIWGSTCETPEGFALSFGGEDQDSHDGIGHTRIKEKGGEWKDIHEELRKANPYQPLHDKLWALRERHKDFLARTRALCFEGLTEDEDAKRIKSELHPELEKLHMAFKDLLEDVAKVPGNDETLNLLQDSLEKHMKLLDPTVGMWKITPRVNASNTVMKMRRWQHMLETWAEWLDAEPPPRALSMLVYEPKTKVFVLFGGDHLDYLMNDTFVFDPAKKRWLRRWHETAPPPRANHVLKAADGKVILTGGYTYTSNTDYMGGQYRDLDDGEWIYDVEADKWSGRKGVPQWERVYRTGPFDPDYYLQGERPDASATAKKLKNLPANTWVTMNPPQLPKLNRDWGTAVLDPDRDLILRWSGGHCAHGGSDVLHYHLGTNRWELPCPVEFPLGQLYSNTSYPDGFNFNRRPWVTGHTYQNYGYDPVAKLMLFTGRERHTYYYDPDRADWTGRAAKPKDMCYNSCFYTLTVCPTPKGLVTWTEHGKVFRYDAEKKEWGELKLNGVKLPGSVVDNSTVVHDAKRDRLLFARKLYGDKAKYDGELYALDLQTNTVSTLSPKGMEAANAIPYLCQLRYDAANDLLLVGATLPPEGDRPRRTPAFDCATNRWITLALGGTDPSGKAGRNVSLGLMYDAKRKLFWAVDTNSQVYVLRLDVKSADVKPLGE
jgi:sialidase-1